MNTENQAFLDAINQYGGPFKKGVLNALKEFTGISIVAEEYPAGLAGDRTAIDIVAAIEHGHCICYLTIECKRALAPFKKWVFFAETASKSFKVGRGISGTTSISAGSHWAWLPGITMCSDACEVKEEAVGKSLKASPDPIYKAATQASLGYLSFLQERIPDAPSLKTDFCPRDMVVIPLIVTTAELLLSDEDGSSVNMDTGLCELKVPKSVPWVGYRFPCHPTTKDRTIDSRIINPMASYVSACIGIDSTTADSYKETIFVVQANQLKSFVNEPLFVILNHIMKVMINTRKETQSSI